MNRPLSQKILAANARLFIDGDLGAVGEFFATDYVVHLTEQDLTAGHKTVQGVLAQLRQAFPDIQAKVEILVESDDRIAWQRTLSGTQKGPYKGFPASGRRVVWRDMVTSRFGNELIAEEWVLTDLAERLLLSRKR